MSMRRLNGAIDDMCAENNCTRSALGIDGMMRAALESLLGNADEAGIQDAINAALEHQESKWQDMEYWNKRSRETHSEFQQR